MNRRDAWIKISVAFYLVWAFVALFAIGFAGVIVWAIIKIVLKVTE